MNNALDAALDYAARGWPVFPCRPGRKDPATLHGFKDATTDPSQIRAWWTANPSYNVAIATGEKSVDVLDIDIETGSSGYAAFMELQAAGLIDGHGWMVRTRSGGLHVYFQGSSQRPSDARDHSPVDFKASGGYVLAPPSFVEADDKPAGSYERLGDDLEATSVLDWRIVKDILVPPAAFQQPPPVARHAGALSLDDRAGDDYAARTSWEDILTPHGWRQIRHVGNARYWCRPGKTGLFTSATTREDGGLYVFSTSTPFDTDVPYSKFGAYTILEHGGDYRAAARTLRAAGYGTPLPVITGPAAVADPSESEQEAIAARYSPVDWHEAWSGHSEETQWLIDGFLEAGTVNSLFAKAGTGKSLLALDVARQLARDGHIVVYVDDENRVADLVERLRDMGCKPEQLDRLLVYSFAGLPALDTAAGGMHLKAIAIAQNASLVILDTTSRMVAGRENDADTFLQLYRCSLVGLKKLGITVLRLDHPGKDMTKGQRGSSAKEGDVDTIWRLEPVAGTTYRLEREKSRSGHGEPVFTLQRQTDPLRHEWEIAGTDNHLVQQIAGLSLPKTYGRDKVRAALHQAGIDTPGNDALSAAIRTWKLTFTPGVSVPESSAPYYWSDSVPDTSEPIHESPLQASPGQPQDRQDRQPVGGSLELSPEASPVGGASGQGQTPVPDSSPLCTRCGEYHHRYGPGGRPCFQQPASTR